MVKALIITYYWPPAGGPGVQRWLKFATYLEQYGVVPVVYVPENPSYAIVDQNISEEVPQGLTIIKHPIKEPYSLAKRISKSNTQEMSKGILPDKTPSILARFMLFVRGNFFIPDARIGWVKPSVSFLKDYVAKNPVDVIITTGPPHSVHLIGLGLKQETNCRWIADFRDPWTTIGYHVQLRLSKRAARKHKKLESQVLNTADQVIVTSPTTAREFTAITNKPIEVITNGYDTNDNDVVRPVLDSKFSIAHIGSFLTQRNPTVLWKVLAELCEEIDSFSKDLQLVLAGYISENVLKSIANHSLSDTLNNLGYISHYQAITIQKKSQLLLLVEIDSPETKCIIPGKLFEYLKAGRPILSIGPKGGDIEDILKSTATGSYFDKSQKEDIKIYIRSCYEQFKAGRLELNPHGIEQYSRNNLSQHLAQLIDAVMSR